MPLPSGKIQSSIVAKTRKRFLQKTTSRGVFSVSLLAAATQLAYGAAEFKMGDDASVSFGFGLRTSYTNTENAAPNGSSYSNQFNVENVRLYINGQYGKYLKATFNTERTGGPACAEPPDGQATRASPW